MPTAATIGIRPRRCRGLALDDLAGLGRRAEGDVSAGDGLGAFVAAERVVGREVLAGQLDVPGRDVVEVGVAFQPAELGVVRADDAAVGRGADAEVEVSVRADRRAVGVVVADARQLVHQDASFRRRA